MPSQNLQNLLVDKNSLTSNNNNDDEIVNKYVEENSKITARKRWKILAKVLFKSTKEDIADVSVRRFTSFGVFAPTSKIGCWLHYTTSDKMFSISIQHLNGNFSAKDLMGFNNTGNICVWPSEETLSVYITSNLHLFSNKSVLELGGGMSCMAGLMVAKYGEKSNVRVTDGNAKSIENVQVIINQNMLDNKVKCSVLKWQDLKKNGLNSNIPCSQFDIVLVADCLFFDEVRKDLIHAIWFHLGASGVAYVMAPQRGTTLDQFITASQDYGFSCVKNEKYDKVIWERHLKLLETDLTYDPSLHYPILLKLTKVNCSP